MRNTLGAGNDQSVLQRAYIENARYNPAIPKAPGVLPALLERVRPVHEVVPVEYFLPGCPPPAARIKSIVAELLKGGTPKLQGADLKFG